MELTIEQKRALAIANARKRAASGQNGDPVGQPTGDASDGAPDPSIAAYTGEVLSGDPERARRAIVRDEYERMGTGKRALVAADDIVRLTADGLGFGLPDTIGGKLSEITGIGPTREQRRQNTEDARTRAGLAGTVAEVAGNIKTLGKLPGKSPTQLMRNKALSARMLAAGGEGAAIATMNELGHEREVDASDLALGAAGGAAGSLLAAGASKAGDLIGQGFKKATGKVPKVPSSDELTAAANAAYKAADDAGVMVSKNGIARLRQQVVDDLTEFGFHPTNQPGAAAALDEIERIAQGNVTLKGLEQARRLALGGFKADNKSNNKALGKIIERIDEFAEGLGSNADDVLMGDAKTGAQALKEARSMWARKAKSEAVENAIKTGDRSASMNASGGNTENRIRQEVGKLVSKPQRSRGWTAEEKELAEEIARGTPGNNLLRQLGRAGIQGNGVGMMAGFAGAGAASYTQDPRWLILSALGTGAKPLSTAMTRSKAKTLAEMMRAGGSEAARRGPDNALQRLSKSKRDLLARLLTTGAIAYGPARAQQEP